MKSKRYVLRGFAGVGIGLGYGLLAGAVTFVFLQALDDRGPMIPDNRGWGLLAMLYTTFIVGICGVVVGLVVSLSGAKKNRGAMIGAGVGLMVCLPFFVEACPGPPKLSWPLWREFFQASFFFLMIFPFGLALTGMVVSIAARKLIRAPIK